MNGHIIGETSCFFHKHVKSCVRVCEYLEYWMHVLGPIHTIGTKTPSESYDSWKITPAWVRKQMQFINLTFAGWACNKHNKSYNMINTKQT